MSRILSFLVLSYAMMCLMYRSASAKEEVSSTSDLITGTNVYSTENIETATPSDIIGLQDVKGTSTTLNNNVMYMETSKMSTVEENISTTRESENLEHSSETVSEVSAKIPTPSKIVETPLIHKSVVKHNRQMKSTTTQEVEETSSTSEMPNNLSREPLRTSVSGPTSISALSDNEDDLTTVEEESAPSTPEETVSSDDSSMETQTQKIKGKSITDSITETTTTTSVSEIKEFENHSLTTRVKEIVGKSLNQSKKQIADNLEHTRKLGMLAAEEDEEKRYLKGCNRGDRPFKHFSLLNAIMFYLVCSYANYI